MPPAAIFIFLYDMLLQGPRRYFVLKKATLVLKNIPTRTSEKCYSESETVDMSYEFGQWILISREYPCTLIVYGRSDAYYGEWHRAAALTFPPRRRRPP